MINHPPVFSSITTLVNNLDPGGTFTISTVSTDNDTVGTADTLSFYVCYSNSANFAGCAGGPSDTVCSASATSSPNAKCYYSDTAPTPAGNTTYYGFLYDSHGVAAAANSRSSTYTINNTASSLGTLQLNGGNNIDLFLKGTTTPVNTYIASVSDQNGCQSLLSATAKMYMSNVSGGYNCSANDNDCYSLGTTQCSLTGCGGASDYDGAFTCTTSLKYFAIPTNDIGNNTYEPYNWLSRITIYDGSNYTSTSSAGVELNTNTALDVLESKIDFGSDLFMGDNTGSANQTTTIVNIGNSPIKTNLSGTDMQGQAGGTITAGYIEWKLDSFNWSSGNDLSTVGEVISIYGPRPSSTSDVLDLMYWGIGIPYGSNATDYRGTNTFAVVLGDSGW